MWRRRNPRSAADRALCAEQGALPRVKQFDKEPPKAYKGKHHVMPLAKRVQRSLQHFHS